MKKKLLLLLVIVSSLINTEVAWSYPVKFRVVGYVRESAVINGDALKIDMDRITHLNIAFINPDSNGRLKIFKNLNQLILKAHQQHVKVLVSLGGGLTPAYYTQLLMDDKRDVLVNNLLGFVADNHLDGLDIDLEGEHIDNNYETFILSLATRLKAKHKLLTAAVATVYSTRYSDKALRCMDFINIMSYDKTGSWKPENAGQHAPYHMAIEDLSYWIDSRGMPGNKVNLGLPFYGYGFGKNAPEDISYNDLIKKYPGSKDADQVSVDGGGIIYYNGSATITKKTKLAMERAGGVMIWQLLQDATAGNSLLTLIDKTIGSYRH